MGALLWGIFSLSRLCYCLDNNKTKQNNGEEKKKTGVLKGNRWVGLLLRRERVDFFDSCLVGVLCVSTRKCV